MKGTFRGEGARENSLEQSPSEPGFKDKTLGDWGENVHMGHQCTHRHPLHLRSTWARDGPNFTYKSFDQSTQEFFI